MMGRVRVVGEGMGLWGGGGEVEVEWNEVGIGRVEKVGGMLVGRGVMKGIGGGREIVRRGVGVGVKGMGGVGGKWRGGLGGL